MSDHRVRADKQPVLLAVDTKGNSVVLAKGPEVGLAKQKALLKELFANGGRFKGSGKETLQLVSASISKGSIKRRFFDPDYTPAKAVTLSKEQQAKAAVAQQRDVDNAKVNEADRAKMIAKIAAGRKRNAKSMAEFAASVANGAANQEKARTAAIAQVAKQRANNASGKDAK